MPASTTRSCIRCERELPTRLFRDEHEEHLTGRTSRVCRNCRAKDPALVETLAKSRSYRAARRAIQHGYAARSPEQVDRVRQVMHPDGTKKCPAFSGCGQELPFADFSPNRFQRDGLSTTCSECSAERSSLTA